MIKIISISNHHQWDGVELSVKAFERLIDVLQMSKWAFVCDYEHDGISRQEKWGI